MEMEGGRKEGVQNIHRRVEKHMANFGGKLNSRLG